MCLDRWGGGSVMVIVVRPARPQNGTFPLLRRPAYAFIHQTIGVCVCVCVCVYVFPASFTLVRVTGICELLDSGNNNIE
jgi:hypothetical protein